MKKGCSIIAVIGLIIFLIGGYFAFNFLKKYKLGNVAKEGYILVPTGANFEQVLDSISPYLKNKESFKEVALKKNLDQKDRKSTRLNSSHSRASRMPSSA